ncbi:pentapeptide repeat-containing protein [Actinoplanes utahensis]|uniref:Pentapeptide repeat-containing protein n=1 Tax=Actinoplanes utahensis TaxID=1869 RepID=A0A0A6X4V9_ACTUT|nr:pentapeptide repeat-containing protein [Actinoplanes utahensis]KHD75147.1 hypothetical protein MB27_24855 [Actinoplanes utahensis]GIF27100.1 hypothetical protein Aut01nite_00860 [Actinoplanes utahensis]
MNPAGSPRDASRRRLRALGSRSPRLAPRRGTDGRAGPGGRKSLLPGISSAITALAAVFAILISWLTFRINRDGQITARYTSAVEQLGNREMITRVGAFYSLGRIALESDHDRPVIIDMLVDYVQDKAGMKHGSPEQCHDRPDTSLDVIAALRVLLIRIERTPDDHRLNLRRVCLRGIQLPGADLTCVRLDNAVVEYSNFAKATLVDASLQHTRFGRTILDGAVLDRADAFDADFSNINHHSMNTLVGATLRGTNLMQARFVGADLTGADLTAARLTGADLESAELGGARLDTYLADAYRLPPGVDRTDARASAPPSPPAASSGCRE